MKVRVGFLRIFHSLSLPEKATVYDLKVKVRDRLGVAVEDQQLVYNGIDLQDDIEVEDYQIEDNSPIILDKLSTYRVHYENQIYECNKVPDSATVVDLKNIVEKRIGVPAEKQALFYDGKELLDPVRIGPYNFWGHPIVVYRKFEILIYGKYHEYGVTVHEAMTVEELKHQLQIKYEISTGRLKFKTHRSHAFLNGVLTLKIYGIDTSTVIYLYGDGDD